MIRKRIMLMLLASPLLLPGCRLPDHDHQLHQVDGTCPDALSDLELQLGPAGQELLATIQHNRQSIDVRIIHHFMDFAASSDSELGQLIGESLAFAYWTYLVRSGGQWDQKAYVFNTFSDNQDGNIELIAGMPVTYEAYSNIHFALVGRTLGFSGWVLQAGAGANQVLDHGFNPHAIHTYFDDQYDNAAIRLGIALYDQCGADFTAQQFIAVYMAFADALKVCDPNNCDYIAVFQ